MKNELHIWIPYDSNYVEIFDSNTNYCSDCLYSIKDIEEELKYLKKEIKRKMKLINEQFEELQK